MRKPDIYLKFILCRWRGFVPLQEGGPDLEEDLAFFEAGLYAF